MNRRLDVAGCERVTKAADSADRKINIAFGFQQRYGGVYVKAKQLLDSGAIGKVREVHGEFLKFALKGDEPVPPPPRNERENSSNGSFGALLSAKSSSAASPKASRRTSAFARLNVR